MNKGLFTSKTAEWATPLSFFAPIQKEFLLNADVCATKENAKLEAYWTKEEDGLAQDWAGIRAWMNPPYGREIGKWVKKASDGGGRHSSLSFTSSNRHSMVPRLYLSEAERGNPIFERSPEVWRIKELRPVP